MCENWLKGSIVDQQCRWEMAWSCVATVGLERISKLRTCSQGRVKNIFLAIIYGDDSKRNQQLPFAADWYSSPNITCSWKPHCSLCLQECLCLGIISTFLALLTPLTTVPSLFVWPLNSFLWLVVSHLTLLQDAALPSDQCSKRSSFQLFSIPIQFPEASKQNLSDLVWLWKWSTIQVTPWNVRDFCIFFTSRWL